MSTHTTVWKSWTVNWRAVFFSPFFPPIFLDFLSRFLVSCSSVVQVEDRNCFRVLGGPESVIWPREMCRPQRLRDFFSAYRTLF